MATSEVTVQVELEAAISVKAAAPKIYVAKLDHDGVYFGLEERAIDEVKTGDLVFADRAVIGDLPEGSVYVDKSCDNAPGKYRWVPTPGGIGQFAPLPHEQQKAALAAPTLEECVYDLIANGPSGTVAKAWALWFENTLDAVGKKGA